MTTNPMIRINFANLIQETVDNPDRWYNGETEPTKKLIEYLKKHDITIPKLPEDEERRKDTVKLMARAWSAIEALNLINELREE